MDLLSFQIWGQNSPGGVGETQRKEGQGKTTSHTAVLRQEGGRLLKIKKHGSRWLVGKEQEQTAVGPR